VADLAPFLKPGANVISIVARHFGTATSWWMPVPPSYSMGAGGVVFETLVGDEWLISDRSWRCAPVSPWTPVPVPGDVACLPLESFDARVYEHGWESPDFDASGWKQAFEITPFSTGGHGDPHPPSEPFGMLRPPVRVAFPGGDVHTAELVAAATGPGAPFVDDPVAQVYADEALVVAAVAGVDDLVHRASFDLGHIAAGTVRLEVSAAPGSVVDVAASEHVDESGALVSLGQHAGLRYVCAGGDEPERFESLDVIGARHLHVSVRSSDPAVAPDVTLAIADRHRPRTAGASFECSDPLLNQVYEVGLRTVDLCALDAYVDCPTREQRAWTGDSVVHQMVDLVANPDWSMARWHPQVAAQPRYVLVPVDQIAADYPLPSTLPPRLIAQAPTPVPAPEPEPQPSQPNGQPLTAEQSTRRCNAGRLIGGLAGGGIGYMASRKDGRSWAVPLGALLGTQMGCPLAQGRGPLSLFGL